MTAQVSQMPSLLDFAPVVSDKTQSVRADDSKTDARFSDELKGRAGAESKIERAKESGPVKPKDDAYKLEEGRAENDSTTSDERDAVVAEAAAQEEESKAETRKPAVLVMQDDVVTLSVTPVAKPEENQEQGAEQQNLDDKPEVLEAVAEQSKPQEKSFVEQEVEAEKPVVAPVVKVSDTKDPLAVNAQKDGGKGGVLGLDENKAPTQRITPYQESMQDVKAGTRGGAGLENAAETSAPNLKPVAAHVSMINADKPGLAVNQNRAGEFKVEMAVATAKPLPNDSVSQLWKDLGMKFSPKPEGNAFDLTLSPPNSGKLHFSFEEVDGRMQGTIVVEDENVFAHLQKDGARLASLLVDAGYKDITPGDLSFKHDPSFFSGQQNAQQSFSKKPAAANFYQGVMDDVDMPSSVTASIEAALLDGRKVVMA